MDLKMETETIFHKENERISSKDILQALAHGKEVKLVRCTVSGELDINRLLAKDEYFDCSNLSVRRQGSLTLVTLSMPIAFNSCIFEENVCFAAPWESAEEIETQFKRDVVFNSSVFCGQVRFREAVFRGLAGFDGCVFKRISTFRGVTFHGRAMFRTATFDGYGLFNGALFCKEGRFANACFGKGGNFTGVRFNGHTDFSGVYSKSKSVPVYESVRFGRRRFGEDVTFWRFIKQSSQDAGLYRQAGEAFYSEMCAHFWRQFHGPKYSELNKFQKFIRICMAVRLLPELIFGRMLFGYGERPVRVLVASVIIIVVCAFFYASPFAQLSGRVYVGASDMSLLDMPLLDGLYFSTTTFTTLGFGDIFPTPTHLLTRIVAMAEAVSGASLMALFVVCLSKRFSRG